MTTSEDTSARVAAAAIKVLRDSRTSKAAKSAAGLALSQRMTPYAASSRAATAASRALRRTGSSKAAKTAAGRALTQKPKC